MLGQRDPPVWTDQRETLETRENRVSADQWDSRASPDPRETGAAQVWTEREENWDLLVKRDPQGTPGCQGFPVLRVKGATWDPRDPPVQWDQLEMRETSESQGQSDPPGKWDPEDSSDLRADPDPSETPAFLD